MRRWLRWLVNSMVILSALLCIATTVLWIQHTWDSHWTDGGWGESPQPLFRWRLDKYGFRCAYFRRATVVVSKLKACANIDGLGFHYHHNIGQSALTEESFHFYIRYWFLLAVGSILPICWFCNVMWHKKLKPKIGMCETCGYDLRATPDRCPECGTIKDVPCDDASSS